jgi:hypothetical protein
MQTSLSLPQAGNLARKVRQAQSFLLSLEGGFTERPSQGLPRVYERTVDGTNDVEIFTARTVQGRVCKLVRMPSRNDVITVEPDGENSLWNPPDAIPVGKMVANHRILWDVSGRLRVVGDGLRVCARVGSMHLLRFALVLTRAPARTCRCELWQLPIAPALPSRAAQRRLRRAGLDPASAFFSTGAEKRRIPDQVRDDGEGARA